MSYQNHLHMNSEAICNYAFTGSVIDDCYCMQGRLTHQSSCLGAPPRLWIQSTLMSDDRLQNSTHSNNGRRFFWWSCLNSGANGPSSGLLVLNTCILLTTVVTCQSSLIHKSVATCKQKQHYYEKLKNRQLWWWWSQKSLQLLNESMRNGRRGERINQSIKRVVSPESCYDRTCAD